MKNSKFRQFCDSLRVNRNVVIYRPFVKSQEICYLETSREKDWDNVVTCHLGYSSGVTWSTMKRAKGKFKLGQDGSKKKVATVCSRF